MAPTGRVEAQSELRQRQLVIDPRYTVDELEWERIVGPAGIAHKLLTEMASLSSGVFNFEPLGRIPETNGERFEFAIEGDPQTVEFDYDVSPTSRLVHGLRHLFGAVNRSLQRAGLEWRFALTRRISNSTSPEYQLVMAPRAYALERRGEMDIVAGLDVREFEFAH